MFKIFGFSLCFMKKLYVALSLFSFFASVFFFVNEFVYKYVDSVYVNIIMVVSIDKKLLCMDVKLN